ncbi:inositol-tetrakisphosphate 1-kinase-like [Phytophthora cinnamomi]|uniref:inositol-tetrakisphosphate 1-kinase-like n=1 Tax=Phytophthora cinnamomi TaxID=4785 RepID=UPI00355A5DEB|nr:inositol-tetrakisphosphate 1-kinase-like [Phytophthora cinnamomi]
MASSSAASSRPLVVGVIFPAKKIARLQEVLDEEADGVRFVLIDLEAATPAGGSATDAELQAAAERLAARYGPLDALLHKLAHDMVFAQLGDGAAADRVRLVQLVARRHPSLRVVDPIDSVRLLTDRHAACRMLRALQQEAERGRGGVQRFKVPSFRVVESPQQFQALLAELDAGRTRLPLICKSVEACATDRSHIMSVVTKREDLHYVEYPALYQEFVNHSSRLFKGYVLGDIINVAERRSLPNLVAGTAQRVLFNTQENYPTSKDFHPHADATSQDEAANGWTQEEIFTAVRAIGERLRDELKLTLFGFDVIVADDGSQDLYVIDVNYFPSYRELDDLSAILRKHVKKLCGRQ